MAFKSDRQRKKVMSGLNKKSYKEIDLTSKNNGHEKYFDELTFIMDWEGGNPTYREYFEGFSEMIKNGHVWSLQGMYGREATRLIDSGFIDRKGKINWKKIDESEINLDDHLYDE